MPKRLLDVGNCSADSAALGALVQRRFGAEVERAHSLQEALAALRRAPFDLVLVNRVFDATQEEGLALIRAVRQDSALAAVPLMLITNYPQHAAAAVAAGAAPGFGKRDLAAAETLAKLREYLE